MVGKRPARALPDIEGTGQERPSADDERAAGVREELQHLVESAREAYEEVSDRDMEQQVREFYDTARHAYARMTGDSEHGGEGGDGGGPQGARRTGREHGAESAGRRALEMTKQGGKAAGLAAVGIAGGAALESVRHGGISLHLPVQRRSSGPKAVIDKVRDRVG